MAGAVALTSMITCRGGVFRMGTPRDKLDQIQRRCQIFYEDLFTPETPQHAVELAPFTIDIHPVANAQFFAFLMAQPFNLQMTYRDSHPPTEAGPHVGFRCARTFGDGESGAS